MILLTTLAHAAVPEVLAERTFGLGLDVALRGIPLTALAVSSDSGIMANTSLFRPSVSARFQLGRLALAPRLGFSYGTSRTAEDATASTTLSGRVGVDVRAYPLNAGPFHLVGLVGLDLLMSHSENPDAEVFGATTARTQYGGVTLGGGVEWIPSARFSVDLNARMQFASLSSTQYDPDPEEITGTNASVGIQSFLASAAAHIWF